MDHTDLLSKLSPAARRSLYRRAAKRALLHAWRPASLALRRAGPALGACWVLLSLALACARGPLGWGEADVFTSLSLAPALLLPWLLGFCILLRWADPSPGPRQGFHALLACLLTFSCSATMLAARGPGPWLADEDDRARAEWMSIGLASRAGEAELAALGASMDARERREAMDGLLQIPAPPAMPGFGEAMVGLRQLSDRAWPGFVSTSPPLPKTASATSSPPSQDPSASSRQTLEAERLRQWALRSHALRVRAIRENLGGEVRDAAALAMLSSMPVLLLIALVLRAGRPLDCELRPSVDGARQAARQARAMLRACAALAAMPFERLWRLPAKAKAGAVRAASRFAIPDEQARAEIERELLGSQSDPHAPPPPSSPVRRL